MNPLLMTGADGLVGSRFTELYKEEWAIDNLSLATGHDITDREQMDEIIKDHPTNVVIHFAAFTDTAAAAAQEGDEGGAAYQVNVIGTGNIAQACAKHGKHLIHISTDFVFDGEKEGAYTEEDQPNPIEWYGQTKWLAEQAVTNSGAKSLIARLSFPYRAEFKGKLDYVAKIRKGIEEGTLYPQFSDTLITPTFVDDIAHALQTLIEEKATGLYHVTGGQAYSNYRAAHAIADAFHLDGTIIKESLLEDYLKEHPERRFQRRLDVCAGKLERDFGISMSTLEEGLATITEQTDLIQFDNIL